MFLITAIFNVPGQAAPPPQVDLHVESGRAALVPLSFDALVLSDHPLTAARADAATAHQAAARRLGPLDANPTVSVTPGARVAGIDAPGPEWAVAVGQEFALGDQLDARRDAVAAEGRVLRLEVDVERLERRLMAAHLWLDAWRLGGTLDLLKDEAALAVEALGFAEDALARGAGTRSDTLQMESWQSEIALRRLETEGALFDNAVALAAALGATTPDAAGLPTATGPLPAPPLPSREVLASLGVRLPASRLAELEAELAIARARESAASRDLRLAVSVQADADAEGNTGVRVGLSAPLPVFDRTDRSLPTAKADVTIRRAEAAEAARRIAWRLAQLDHDLQHWREVALEIQTRTLPAVERVVALQAQRLKAGEGTRLELLDARRRRLDLLTRQMHARVELARAGIEAWLLWQAAESTPPNR